MSKVTAEGISSQRSSQIAAICFKFAERPLPKGMKHAEMMEHLSRCWDAGFETGKAEVMDATNIHINKERKTQVLRIVEILGLETEHDIEIFLHTWTAGVLTARDMMGISTPTNPGESYLTRVRVDDS